MHCAKKDHVSLRHTLGACLSKGRVLGLQRGARVAPRCAQCLGAPLITRSMNIRNSENYWSLSIYLDLTITELNWFCFTDLSWYFHGLLKNSISLRILLFLMYISPFKWLKCLTHDWEVHRLINFSLMMYVNPLSYVK